MNKAFKPFHSLWTNERARALFWVQVDKTGDCWEWKGCKHKLGYGILTTGNRPVKAHRASFFLANGYMLLDMDVLHSCDNRACVNPAHLRLGTHAENMADMASRGRARTIRRFGKDNPMARYSWDQVCRMRELAASGVSQADIARQFNASKMAVNRIVRNISWRTV